MKCDLATLIINTCLPVKDVKAGVLTSEFDRFLEQVKNRNLPSTSRSTYSEINSLVLNPGSYLPEVIIHSLGQKFPQEILAIETGQIHAFSVLTVTSKLL